MPGLFSSAAYKSPVQGFVSNLPKCEACSLYKKCNSPKMEVDGDGRKGILVVGEAPGETEDEKGRPFVGKAGKLLKDALRGAGVELRRDCFITNAIICHPKGNATPDAKQIAYCRPNLTKAIRETKPKAILVLGGPAVKAVIGPLWKEDTGGIMRWAGFAIPNRSPNSWIVPTYHPSFVLRSEKDPLGPLIDRRFRMHVARAAALASEGVPWPEGPPDYRDAVQVILGPREAAKEIARGAIPAGPTAFDLETNMLKPDDPDARIVCASICFGGESTIAFPMIGEAVEVFKNYLRQKSPKIGANLKFEYRWCRRKLGVRVKGVGYSVGGWDGVVAAHAADHRPDITSVKFQGFVLTGQPDYDSHIKPYLQSAGPRIPNRIHEIDLKELLTYCGIDSHLEYKIAEIQSERFGWHNGWKRRRNR